MKKKKFLVISAHPDDAEIGLGGTILKQARAGHDVFVLDMTSGEPTPYGTEKRRRQEAARASKILNIKQRINLNLPNRYLFDSKENRLLLAEQIRLIQPDVLFCPYPEDAHPDHIATTKIAEAARFYAKLTKVDLLGDPHYPPKCLYYYFCSHARLMPKMSFFIDISDTFDEKAKALKCYRSQFVDNPKNIRVFDAVKTMNHYWGLLNKVAYAEGLYAKEAFLINDLCTIL